MKKKILITGINGFLGSHLAAKLNDEFEVIGLEYNLDNLHRIQDCGYKVYASENESIEDVFREHSFYGIIHAATVYRRENDPYEKLVNTNVLMPVQLFELGHKHNSLVFINTDSYFNDVSSKYSYLTDYTLSKKHALEWLKEMKGPCALVNLKLYHMFGPNDAVNKFVPSIIKSLINNEKDIPLTPGEQERDFIYIDDVVSAYEMVLQSSGRIAERFTEFEVGSGETVSIKNFVSTVKDLTNSKSNLHFGKMNYRENEIMHSVANVKALRELGWEPKFNYISGLKEFL